MAMKSTPERYGTVALTLHWLSAGLILTLIPMGFALSLAPDTLRLVLTQVHAAVGLTVGLLTLIRLAWWLALDRRPQPVADQAAFQRLLARVVHGALYGGVLLLMASGIGMLLRTGLGAALVSGDPSLIPADLMRQPPRLAHGAMARILIGLLALHVIGALYHHWIRRDGTMERMLPRMQ